jgi:hypothetical protein
MNTETHRQLAVQTHQTKRLLFFALHVAPNQIAHI